MLCEPERFLKMLVNGLFSCPLFFHSLSLHLGLAFPFSFSFFHLSHFRFSSFPKHKHTRLISPCLPFNIIHNLYDLSTFKQTFNSTFVSLLFHLTFFLSIFFQTISIFTFCKIKTKHNLKIKTKKHNLEIEAVKHSLQN